MIRGTYFTALANEDVVPPTDARVFAVVSDLPEWADDLVDRNLPHLAPPEELLSVRKRIEDVAEQNGEDDPRAIAWQSVDFEERYREHITSGGSREVLGAVVEAAESGVVYLVSWRSRSSVDHRSVLLDIVREQTKSSPCAPTEHEWGRGVVPTVVVCVRCGYGSTTLSTGQLAQDGLKPYLGGRR